MRKILIFILGLSSSFAFADNNSTSRSITQCAELLPNGTYSVGLTFNTKDNKTDLSTLSVSDVNAREVIELPKKQLATFTKCIMPLISSNPLAFDDN